jgi:DNA-binding NtrC family response regulator
VKDQTTARESAPTPHDDEARVIVHGPSGPKVFVAVRGGTVIGRAFPSDLIVDDPSVSKQHVRIALADDGSVRFSDLGSTNGVWLNGLRVMEGTLARGDTLRAGAAQIEPYVRPSVDVPGVLAFESFAHRLTDARQRHLTTTQPFSVLVVEGEHTVPLAEWAPRVLAALRAEDRAARLRDEALVVLLVDASESEARAVASAIAQGDGALGVGVATYPAHGRDASALVAHALADRARGPSLVPQASMVREGVVRGRATEALWGMVDRAAPSSVPVLVLGETGSGKELVAQALHQRSSRADKNFRVVNCGAIPENLVESTLFGAERGAFTGADRMLRGLFEQAHGGTLFLDEVGELPLSAQASLLRVLETGRITRIGGERELAVDVRVVSATHRDLEARCNEGAFRWDLYYRLNGLALELPPLRERRDEIAPLVGLFLRAAADAQTPPLAVDAEAMNALIAHAWPGNIRELRHTIQRAILVTEGPVITLDALPERIRTREGPSSQTSPRPTPPVNEENEGLRDELRKHETRLITEALARTSGNTAAAAALLQIPIRTLTHKMVVLGIRRDG